MKHIKLCTSLTKTITTAAFIILGVIHAPSARAGQVLKTLVLNFNSEAVVEDKDYRFRDRRIPAIEKWIEDNDPDIIFVAEGWNYHKYHSVIEPIAEDMGYDFVYRISMGFPGLMDDSDGILVKKKFHLTQRLSVKLPHSAPSFGRASSWIIPLGTVSWAVGGRIQLEDGTPVYIFSTHLIAGKQSERDDQMIAIHREIQYLAEQNGEDLDKIGAIIGGDFNSSPESSGVVRMGGFGYQDTFGAAHPDADSRGDGCTMCNDPSTPQFNPVAIAAGLFPAQDEQGGNGRIDHILARGPQVTTLASTIVFTKPTNGVWMSDHYGLLSTIAIGGVPENTPLIPNPVRDRDDVSSLSTVIHITPEMLSCSGLRCTNTGPDLNVSSERGVTFINDTSKKVKINFKGAGVWAQSFTTLKPKGTSAFWFEPKREYRFEVREKASHKKYVQTVFSGLQ